MVDMGPQSIPIEVGPPIRILNWSAWAPNLPAKEAWVDYYKVQNDDKNASLFDSTYVHQKKKSICNLTTLSFGGRFTRNYLHFDLSEEHIEANLNGISLIGKNQFVDHHTFVDHWALF